MFARPATALVALLVLTGGAASAATVTLGSATYTTGANETLSVPFTTPDAAVTTGTYDGLVEIAISGIGQSNGIQTNDAFYMFSGNSVAADPGYYQLAFGTQALQAYAPSQAARNDIVGDLGTGQPTIPPYSPAYNAGHVYSFVLDTGVSAPTTLHFGVSDGNFSDNTGAYTLTVTQLAAVPEPASLALVAVGALLAARRRR